MFKKILVGGLLMMTISGFFISSSPKSVYAAPPPTCLPITGIGKQVLHPGPGGIANSGKTEFDLPSTGGFQAYQPCLADDGNDGIGPFEIQGWIWDANLGWISLYCKNGSNLGAACGPYNYGVTMDGPESATIGTLHNNAWSDNAGWISFNCANHNGCATSKYYVLAEPTDPAGLGKVYSGTPAGYSNPHPTESVFGWSDNVGWFDFTDITFPWQTVLDKAKVRVSLNITPLPSAMSADKNVAPIANGTDSYKIILSFSDANDAPIKDMSPYTVKTDFVWDDRVDLDQTDATSGSYSNCSNCGAVTKPVQFQDFKPGAIAGTYEADVTSVAPTSILNGAAGKNGVVTFPFEKFILPKNQPVVPANILILRALNVSVQKGTACVFGTGTSCTPNVVDLPGGNVAQQINFKPPVDIDILNVNEKDYFSAQYNVATNVNFAASCQKSATFDCAVSTIHLQLGVGATSLYKLVFPDTDSDPAANFISDSSTKNLKYDELTLPKSFEIVPVLPAAQQALAQVGDAYIYSTIEYPVKTGTVKYFSNKLPRVLGTVVDNPVAVIRGNVYSTGVTNPQLNSNPIRSLGDVSTNILRDTIFKNVSNIISGIPKDEKTAGMPFNIVGYTLKKGFDVKGENGGTYSTLLPDPNLNNIPRAYYFTGDVTFDQHGGNMGWEGENTIITIGGNIYIKNNLYNDPNSTTKPRMGLIALKDLKTGKGGNIYIDPTVTNIQANMFADGSLFSYDGDSTHINLNDPLKPGTNYGEPIFVSEQSRHDILINQLYIQGSVASTNTIGGAIKDFPILGNGKTEKSAAEGEYGPSPSGRAHARLYDINFLRYYGPVFVRDPVTGDALDLGNPPGIQALLFPNGDLVKPADAGMKDVLTSQDLDPDKDLSAIYIYFEPPTSTLPGFGVNGGLNYKQLKQ